MVDVVIASGVAAVVNVSVWLDAGGSATDDDVAVPVDAGDMVAAGAEREDTCVGLGGAGVGDGAGGTEIGGSGVAAGCSCTLTEANAAIGSANKGTIATVMKMAIRRRERGVPLRSMDCRIHQLILAHILDSRATWEEWGIRSEAKAAVVARDGTHQARSEIAADVCVN